MHNPDRGERPHTRLITAANVGQIAVELVSIERRGKLFGKISRGLYIKTDSRWLLYVSFENYRGPLTINLRETESLLDDFHVGTLVEISSGRIRFPEIEITISTQEVEIWKPPSVSCSTLTQEHRKKRLLEFGRRAIEYKMTAGLATLLPAILGLSKGDSLDGEIAAYQAEIIRWHESNDELPSGENLISLLGCGKGLTPSGDDVILGYLLALNRWKEVLLPTGDLTQLNNSLVAAAYEKTTTLSANLIECAANGLANEHLINPLDWLMGASHQESPDADELFSWGSSSGIDVFVGFVLALSN